MIQPGTSQENRYCSNLAALLVRAYDQSRAGDEPNSKRLMTAYRSLRAKGDDSYRERNNGLVEFAHTLAFEEPRSPRLARFMAAQDERLATAPEPVALAVDVVVDDDVPVTEPEPEPTTTPKPKRVRKPRTKKED